ncbi:hypothetical protein I3842_10G003500 [Carya illinoinensis]|uniref:Sulfite exporter TauE/SafE family protein n=1 Tax=Carya illinoinensis TaxID=32201 RepID=A0A922J1L3_CARIL|nr:hypothetical protein I3842_10G003500 [Carya illinoinensis]
MATRGLVLYLLSGFSVAILSVLFVSHPNYNNSYQNGLTSTNLALPHSPDGSITKTVWPELEFSWRIVLATVIGFLGSACGTVGGVGGGGIFVPMLTLIVGFDTKSAAALSKFLIDTQYEPLVPREDKTQVQILCLNLRWKRILVLLFVWNDVAVCSAWYWVLFFLQFPIALGVFGYEAVKLYREHKKRKRTGNAESICEASIEWTAMHIAFCSLCGILGGTVGGLLGSGGGFILGPLLLEIGVIPQVASATATFVMTFSSSLSVVEFYLLKRFPIPYALYLTSVSVLAGFWGQFFIRKLITILGRASIIIFILSGVIFLSALTMGIIGIETSIQMIRNHEFMGFLGFCSSQ